MDDLISRQTAIYNLANIAKNCAKSDKQKALMGRCIYMIENMPSVQPELKTATFYVDSEGYERCSACNEHESGMRYFNFCPRCGAKMESEDENDD